MVYVKLHHTMTTHLTEELVHYGLAEPPEGAGAIEEDSPDDTVESPPE